MARCPHCSVFEGANHHSLCPVLQRKRDPAMHRHNGKDYPHANDCPHCWREASDIQSAAIESLRAQLAETERERDEALAAIRDALAVWDDYRITTTHHTDSAQERLRAALGEERLADQDSREDG